MIVWIGSVFVASLLGSLHCAGMCGGLVCFVAGQHRRRWRAEAAYHGGRLAAYVVLGALAGALGAGADWLGEAAGVTRAAAMIAGGLMVVWGGITLAAALGLSRRAPETGWRIPVAAILRRWSDRPPALRALALGGLTALLPCGWLWAFVTAAGATGSALRGMAVMAIFWSGTVPALAGVGALARGALGPLRRRVPVLTSVVLIVVGLLAVAGKLHVSAAASSSAPPDAHACH